ncbi:hypothetical protein [Pseudogracilibacillus sp. SO10305]|uniref:hypothetical protein n=1 Tax=Pseudogracilibacillus sp. SO10305 TaxID=3098292 RepID=UPI00300DF635
MIAKKSYFISLDKESITKVSVDDTTEYEVIATEQEIKELEVLLRDNEHQNFWFAMRNLATKPFDEDEVEDIRQTEHDNLMEAYKFIYRFGTDETRRKLEEIGFGK